MPTLAPGATWLGSPWKTEKRPLIREVALWNQELPVWQGILAGAPESNQRQARENAVWPQEGDLPWLSLNLLTVKPW